MKASEASNLQPRVLIKKITANSTTVDLKMNPLDVEEQKQMDTTDNAKISKEIIQKIEEEHAASKSGKTEIVGEAAASSSSQIEAAKSVTAKKNVSAKHIAKLEK